MIHENLAHQLRRDAIEVGAVFPADGVVIDQAQVGFVYERSRLERVIAALVAEVIARQPPQLVIDDRHQLRGRIGISRPPAVEHARDVFDYG